MALIGSNFGSNANNTASTTYLHTAINPVTGALLIMALAYDNAGAQGADPYVSITDASGNIWTSRLAVLNDPGAASAGSTLRIFTTTVTSSGTINNITVTFNTNVTVKASTVTQVTSDNPDGIATFSGLAAGATGSNTTPTITSSSIPSGNLILGALANEGNATITADSDTVNGTWAAQQTNVLNTGTAAMQVASQYKITTGTGTQTYNLTLSAAGDWAIGWISVAEVIGSSFDPFGTMGFFGM